MFGPIVPECLRTRVGEAAELLLLFNLQWLARLGAQSLSLLFSYSSRRRLFIDQTFFEQSSMIARSSEAEGEGYSSETPASGRDFGTCAPKGSLCISLGC
jgi:hypothetical protein